MAIDLPLEQLFFLHDWQAASLGAILRVSTPNGETGLGIRCDYRDRGQATPAVLVPEENGNATFLQQGALRSGAVNISAYHELGVLDPLVVPLERAHHDLFGLLLTTADGTLLVDGRWGGHRGFMTLRSDDPARMWHVSFDAPGQVRVGGVLAIRRIPEN